MSLYQYFVQFGTVIPTVAVGLSHVFPRNAGRWWRNSPVQPQVGVFLRISMPSH